jgi:hypothetical integral membrane protein (TIGR02206 family)
MPFTDFFATNSQAGPLPLFGLTHLTMLAFVVLINISLFFIGRIPNPKLHRRIRIGLASILVINEISYHIWLILTHQWDPLWHLPLHLCSVLVWLSALMLYSKNYTIFELVYFLGIGGALQPLLTSEVGAYGFPHYYAYQIFISHGGIITAAVFMAVVEDFRPSWLSLVRVFIIGNIYLILVTIINFQIGSNYLYILHKPHIATILDFMGPWPWYILAMEAVAVMISLLLYIPFLIQDLKLSKQIKPTT